MDKKTKSSLSAAQIKKYKKLQDKAEENTQNTGYFIDDEDYHYGNLAEDLIYDAKDKEWARERARQRQSENFFAVAINQRFTVTAVEVMLCAIQVLVTAVIRKKCRGELYTVTISYYRIN